MRKIVLEGKLKRVDVVLVHTRRSPISWAIRFGTKSYWNHVALVYVIRHADLGFEHSFIIESGMSGIDIHNIDRYLGNPKDCDVGIKRCEAPWFAGEEPGLPVRRRVRGFSLEAIDVAYDYGLILRIAKEVIGRMLTGGRYVLAGLRRAVTRGQRVLARNTRLTPERYICSGFAQWAYYQAVKTMVEQGTIQLTPEQQQQILWNPDFVPGEPDEQVLLATTPADLAESEKLAWKYLVLRGDVHDCEEVDCSEVMPQYRWYTF
jgi:hypothetical protein